MRIRNHESGAITQKQLADNLNVSQVTVSRALRNHKGVNEKLRKRVFEEATRLGYSIHASNHEARMLRQRAVGGETSTNVICALVDDDQDSMGFGGRVLRGMNREGLKQGCEVVMMTQSQGPLPLVVSRRQVDGVVRMLGDIQLSKGVPATPVPWVSILYDVAEADHVTVENVRGMLDVGRHLCAMGHRSMAFIGPDTDLARERLSGLRAAAAEAGCEVPDSQVRMEPFVMDPAPIGEMLDELLPAGEPLPFTALVAYNDFMADMALHYLQGRGLSVPGDISITGFDGVLPSRLNERTSITTSVIPLEELGAEAVRLLLWRLQNPIASKRRVVISTRFRQGETTGPAKG